MGCSVVSVLGVLDDEDEPEGDDCGSGVDDQLPGIGKTKDGSRYTPNHHDTDRRGKCPPCADVVGDCFGESLKHINLAVCPSNGTNSLP